VQVLASLVPEGIEWPGLSKGNGAWAPTVLTAVVALGDSLAVLDGMQSMVSLLDGRLERVATTGKAGEGPGEFRKATALAATPTGLIAIIDPGNGRLTLLDRTLRLSVVRPFPTEALTESIAFLGGDVYFAQSIVPFMAARNNKFGTAVALLRQGADSAVVVVRLLPGVPRADSVLRLPGPNSLRVTVQDERVLMVAPTAGIVDLIHEGGAVVRFRSCMPPELDAALKKQFAGYDPQAQSGAQRSVSLVSDALLSGDTVFTVGLLPDSLGRLHVDRYRLDGSAIGSVVVVMGELRLAPEIRFWGGPNRLVAYSPEGVIMKLQLTNVP
jgi:hypothetical protein